MFPTDQNLWYYRTLAEYNSGNHAEAVSAAQKYYQLKADDESYSLYKSLQENQKINTKL
jgi:hypothetical protein